jgi:parvulin-like peptidyl-prolyl isomerase
MTEADLRVEFSRGIVMQRVMVEITRNVLVSEREAVAYYEQNIDQFTSPEQVLFGQIIFVFRGADRAPIRERAEQALAELRAGGSLSAVGAKYAIPPNDQVLAPDAASWLSPNDLQPHVAATLAEMTPMSYSEIVEGPFGYSILQLLDRRESTTRPYEEAAQDVKTTLQDRKTSERLDGFFKELLRDAYIEVYAEEFEQLPAILQTENDGAPTGPSR